MAAMITGAAAQEAAPALLDLAACRLDDASVRLSFKFAASPCWDTTEPVVGEGTGEPAGVSVAIGTVATAEICTMNLVINEVVEALPVAAPADALELSVTTPDGSLIGEAIIAVAEPGPECTPPEQETRTASQ
jgi:hypothetical protein